MNKYIEVHKGSYQGEVVVRIDASGLNKIGRERAFQELEKTYDKHQFPSAYVETTQERVLIPQVA